MCGIAGIVSEACCGEARSKVELMLKQLERRGPDDIGIAVWDHAVLGHRRLSIFDLSAAGHQPMLSPNKEVGVVFNGAIYNFVELREILESKGYVFETRTDTEVIVHGYAEWGIDNLVGKLRGMFAFAIWDSNKSVLYLVRDRLGVKPLCYTATGDQFAFASTVRALKRASFGGKINIDGLTDFFEWGFVTDDHSIYDRIEKVRAGEIVEWRRGSISKRRYWDLSSEIDDKISFNDAVEETERLLLKAVECRLQADVAVAALLSGGIDSSLVCWAIGQLGSNVRSFTIGMPGDRSDESSRARLTASELGIEHEVLELNPESPPDMISLSAAYSEPFACSSALGMLAISDRTKQSAKVLLTGDGGDDVFLGYPEHKHFYFSGELAKVLPNQVGQVWKYARSWVPGTGLAKRARSFLNYSTDGLKAVALARDGLRYYEMTNLFGPVLSGCKLQDLQLSEAKGSSQTLLMDFLNYDRRTRFVGEYLPKVDGATMYHALEARCPFLDTDLWEFASRIPLSVRLYKGHLKAILRELVRRRMGRDLSVARKQGFTIPVQRWLGNEWKQLSVDILRNSLVQSNGFIDEAAVRRVIENGNTNTFLPKQIWYVLVLESWLRYEQTWMTER